MQTSLAVAPAQADAKRAKAFAALAHRDFAFYVTGSVLSMMGDNIEHVITYWVLWQTFHSPMLAGFAVVSHWLPFLLFSVYFGGLADRYDCRRVIQISQAMFMSVSLLWGFLFFTGRLQLWHAVVLLIVHGFAGALWSPAEQLIIHDIVGREHLESAVRINATGRQLGILFGPAVGGGLMLLAGPSWGIVVNASIYLPMVISMLTVRYSGHTHAQPARARVGLLDTPRLLGELSGQPTILAMIALAGVSSFLIGSALSAQMPEFAQDLGTDKAGVAYTVLLTASALGAVSGGFLLELSGVLRASVTSAIWCAGLWGVTMAGFAFTSSFPAALVLLFLGGMFQLAFSSMGQTLVQLIAPPAIRGRVIGAFIMAQMGLRTGSGITVGVIGGLIGIHRSLGLASALLVAVVLALLAFFSMPRSSLAAVALTTDGQKTEVAAENTPPCC